MKMAFQLFIYFISSKLNTCEMVGLPSRSSHGRANSCPFVNFRVHWNDFDVSLVECLLMLRLILIIVLVPFARNLFIPNLLILRIERSGAELLLRFTHGKYKSDFPFRSRRKYVYIYGMYVYQANEDANVVCLKLFHHLET